MAEDLIPQMPAGGRPNHSRTPASRHVRRVRRVLVGLSILGFCVVEAHVAHVLLDAPMPAATGGGPARSATLTVVSSGGDRVVLGSALERRGPIAPP